MLGLEAILKKAIRNLRSDRLGREEDVKLAVILPILDALDWNPADPGALRPEYPAGPGRVDYALLCHGRPQVFVEAKRRGALDARAETQLFGYASNNGVPLLVLSDGLCWDFYLSMADGVPEERRFDRLELRDEEEVPEYAKTLDGWLRKRHVASGEARRGAENCLETGRSRARAREAIPQAWRDLLSEPNGLLCDLLAEEVRDRTGVRPRRSDVEEFLRRLPVSRPSSAPGERSAAPSPERPIAEESRETAAEAGVSRFGGDGGRRPGTTGGATSASTAGRSGGGDSLQNIVQELMRIVLEDFPETLDAETIRHLETAKNPLGLKIGNHTLLRKVSDGRIIGGHSRYWKQPFAGRWYVCSQWWKQDHRHNAGALSAWVASLVSGADEAAARNRLQGIADRLSIQGK